MKKMTEREGQRETGTCCQNEDTEIPKHRLCKVTGMAMVKIIE